MIARGTRGLLLLLLVLLAGSCKSVQVEEYDCGCCMQCKYKGIFIDGGADCGCCEADVVADLGSGDAVPMDGGPVDGDGGPVGPTPWVGKACVEHTECTPGMCFTPKFLKDSFGLDVPELEIPNGMCSFPMCNSNDQCGPQGTCFNTKPFSGTDLGICLLECMGLADCRWEEGYSCLRVNKEDEKGACIPDSLQVIIECDDGHCEGQTQELGACDELADCPWKQSYTCYWPDLAAEEGICIGDSEAVAIECDDGHCPMPNVADE